MALQLNTASLPQLTDLVERMFEKGLEQVPQNLRKSGLINEMAIPEGTGQFRRFAELPDRNLYAYTKDQGAAAQQAVIQYGYEKDAQIKRIGLDVGITVEERKQNKYPEVIRRLTDLSEVCPSKIELDLNHRITFGTATTYVDNAGDTIDITVGDGFQMFYTAHTLTGSATTYNNIVPGNPQFSKGSLAAAKRLTVEETFNNIGEKMAMEFDVIFCTDDEDTNNQIDELLNARADITSSNAATFNVYQGAMRKLRLPLLATTATGGVDSTKRKYWGIASSKNTQLHLGMSETPYLKAPRDGNNGEDFSTENWNYAARAAYAIATTGARWIKFSS
jgi:hypothetical protein